MTMQITSPNFPIKFLFVVALLFASPITIVCGQGVKVISEASSGRGVIRLGGKEVRIEKSEDILVRSVAQSNPTTPAELSKAIGWMLDIERFDKAEQYLGQLAGLDLDGQASYELNRVVGSELFYRLARTSELQPQGRALALKVFKAASEWANSDQRIGQLIGQLATDDIIDRSETFAKLNRVGKKAMARVIETFADEKREDDFPKFRGVLYAFGDAALEPLLGAADSSNSSVRTEAIRALGKLESDRALDVLQRMALSQNTPSHYRELANYHLSQAGNNVDVSQVELRLRRRVTRFLKGREDPADTLIGRVEFWEWNEDSSKLESTEITSEIASRIRAAELARTLFEINPQNATNRELHLISSLESQKRLAGAAESIDVEKYLQLATNIGPNEMERVLVRAIELDLMHAATAACEVLKEIGTPAQVVGSQRRPLVEAILVGDRHLQFAAFDAIAKINPRTAYAGSSYVAELAAWLASSRFKNKCAVGHFQNQSAQVWASGVSPLGWDSLVASSSQEFFESAVADPDVGILVISDTLRRPEHRELVQQLRSHWKTKRLPIGLLASSSEKFIRSVRYTEGIDRLLTFPISLDRPAVELQFRQLEEKITPWDVSSDDRYRHAARAVTWLEESTTDPQLNFYNFGTHQQQLLGLLYHPEFTDAAAKILSTQPTASAQRAMLGFVSQGDLPIEAREKVANAFEAAVKRSGIMLTSGEIELQYERYNASESQPEETQKVLGGVLDVIEAQRNRLR